MQEGLGRGYIIELEGVGGGDSFMRWQGASRVSWLMGIKRKP